MPRADRPDRGAHVRARRRADRGGRRRAGTAPSAGATPVARALSRSRAGRRLSAFLALYLLLTAGMAWRLVGVQVVSAAEYRGLAERQVQRELQLPARRGKLYDRAGEPLALSLSAATVYANPPVLRADDVDAAGVAAELAALLGQDTSSVLDALTRDAGFSFVARQVPRQLGEQIAALGLPGVGVLEEPTRSYPGGSLAAQVIGFAGVDNTGLSGLEAEHDPLLAGRPGRLRLEAAPGGLTISAAPREVHPPEPGTDIVLTLDRQIQFAAERALGDALEAHDAKGGSAVVLDAASGEILALASAPSLHPDRIGAADAYTRRSRALTDLFEPGSVSKVITAAAVVEEGLVEVDELFDIPDRYQVGGKRYRDAHRHGIDTMTFAEVIARSSNIGTIQVAERLGDERLHAYLSAFGYGRPPGVGFPGEAAGLLPDVEGWWETSLPTMAIGQGVAVTLLQLADAMQVIASGGEWVQPSLLRGTVGSDGRLQPAEAGQRRRVVSEETARVVTELLAGVVEEEHGTGRNAAVPGYRVAGKTGTAQKPSPTARGYEPGKYIATFAGFAPADDPALVIAVMLDEPDPIWSSVTAAPLFAEIMSFSLRHRRITPADPAPPVAAAPAEEPVDGEAP